MKGTRFNEIIDELMALRNKKNSDYANNDDPNGNFKRVAMFLRSISRAYGKVTLGQLIKQAGRRR